MPARKPRYLRPIHFLASRDFYARVVAAADIEDVQISEFLRAAIKDRVFRVEGRAFHASIDPSRRAIGAGAD
jgi:hypothetical protein